MTDKTHKPATMKGAGWLAGGGVLSGLFAFFGASCCILPVVLVNLGLSGALVANLAVFAQFRLWIIGVTLALVAASFVLAFRGGRRPRARFWISAGAALILVAAAWILPYYEGALLGWLGLR